MTRPVRISIVGYEHVGEKTLSQILDIGSISGGFTRSEETFKVQFSVTSIISGARTIYWGRDRWRSYMKNPDAIIFTIDLDDQSQLGTVHEYWKHMNNWAYLLGIPVAIFANKSDLLEMDEIEDVKKDLIKLMEINRTRSGNTNINNFTPNAKTGEGLIEGLNWLFYFITRWRQPLDNII